jgi:hypothetical protein
VDRIGRFSTAFGRFSTGLSTGPGDLVALLVDPLHGLLLAWGADGDPGHRTAFARGRQAAFGDRVSV